METERRKEEQHQVKSSRNEMQLTFSAISENESFARMVVAAFITPLNPTMEEIADIKTAVSEAVTNAIIHGYDGEEAGEDKENKVYIHCILQEDVLHIEVVDEGKGIENIEQAMEPLFTTKQDMDRSGMGFAFMEAFMDDLEVISEPGLGTTVLMKKKMGVAPWIPHEE